MRIARRADGYIVRWTRAGAKFGRPEIHLDNVVAKPEARAVLKEAATQVDGWVESIAAAFNRQRSRDEIRPAIEAIARNHCGTSTGTRS